MRLTVVLAMGLAALTAAPAMAQKIAPSREYSSTPPATLDKNYGLPTFGTPGAGMPQQRTQAPKPGVKTDPDFFAPPPPAEAEGPSTPDFFSSTTDSTLPRAGRTRPEPPVRKRHCSRPGRDIRRVRDTPHNARQTGWRPMTGRTTTMPPGNVRGIAGAGEGIRTLVCSLGSCRSTIELHPRSASLLRRSRRGCNSPEAPGENTGVR